VGSNSRNDFAGNGLKKTFRFINQYLAASIIKIWMALDKPTVAGPADEKATTSQVAASPTQNLEWMTLQSGLRIEQKKATETSLGLMLETTDGAIATSSAVIAILMHHIIVITMIQ
jgi:hypothetical protein